jgi:hypothetical protein
MAESITYEEMLRMSGSKPEVLTTSSEEVETEVTPPVSDVTPPVTSTEEGISYEEMLRMSGSEPPVSPTLPSVVPVPTEEKKDEPKYTMDSLLTNKDWIRDAGAIYKDENDGEEFKGSKADLARWLRERHSSIGWNIWNMGETALGASDMAPEVQRAWLNSMNIYEDTESDTGSFLRALSNATIEDPTFIASTLLTVGWGGIAKLLGAKAAGAAGMFIFKEQLKKSLAKGVAANVKKELGEKISTEAAENIGKEAAGEFLKKGGSKRVTEEVLKGARKKAASKVGKNIAKLNVPVDTALVGADEIARQSFEMDIDSGLYDEGYDYGAIAQRALLGGGLSFGANRFLDPVQEVIFRGRAVRKAAVAEKNVAEKVGEANINLAPTTSDNDITTAAVKLQNEVDINGAIDVEFKPTVEVKKPDKIKPKGKSKKEKKEAATANKEATAKAQKEAAEEVEKKKEKFLNIFRTNGIDLEETADGIYKGVKNRSALITDGTGVIGPQRGKGEVLLAKLKRGFWADAGVDIEGGDFAQIRRGVDTARRASERNIKDRFDKLTKAIKSDYGVKDLRALDQPLLKAMDDALRGDREAIQLLNETAPKVMKEIGGLRENINDLQTRLLDSGAIKEGSTLEATIKASMKDGDGELYLVRAFESFDNPDWGANLTRTPEGLEIIKNARKVIASGIANEGSVRGRNFNTAKILKESGEELTEKQQKLYDSIMDEESGEVTKVIDSLLDVHSEEDLFRVFKGREHIFGKNPLKILTKRGDISDEIRLLMGEYKDPFTNYANTVTKLFQTTEQFRYEKQISDLINSGKISGTAAKRLPAEDITEELQTQFQRSPGVRQTFVAESVEDVMGEQQLVRPLSGLYANKQIADAILMGNEIPLIKGPRLWQNYLLLQGHTRAAKTVWSPTAISRNFIGAAWMALGAGYMRPSTLRGIQQVAKGLSSWGDDALKAEMEKQIYLGNIQSGTDFGAFRGALKDAGESGFWDGQDIAVRTKSGLISRAKHYNVKAVKFYQSMDDMWKQFAFLNEKKNYEQVLLDMGENPHEVVKRWMSGSGEEIVITKLDEYASHQVSRHMQNYAGVPQFVRYARLAPAADFLAFTTEMIRTQKNIVKDALKDMREGSEMMKQGIRNEDGTLKGQAQARVGQKRLGSMIVAQSAAPATAGTSAYLTGMDKKAIDEDTGKELPYTKREGFDAFNTPWEEGVSWLYLGDPKNGKARRFNLSYINPWAKTQMPIRAALDAFNRGEYVDGAIDDAFYEVMLKPVAEALGPSMLATAIIDMMRNSDEHGRPIYDVDDSAGTKVISSVLQGLEAFEPGILKWARDMHTVYTAPEETFQEGRIGPFGIPYNTKIGFKEGGRRIYGDDTWMSLLGIKPQTIDIKELVGFKLNSFKRRMGNSKNVFKDVYQSRAPITKEDLLNTYRESLQRQYDAATEMYDFVTKAKSAGLSNKQIILSVTEDGLFKNRLDKRFLRSLVERGTFVLPSPRNLYKDIYKWAETTKKRTGVRPPVREAQRELGQIYSQFTGTPMGER